MGDLDSDGILHRIENPAVLDQCHAAWVLAGLAASHWTGPATGRVPKAVAEAAHDVLWMLDVATPDVLRNRPSRQGQGGRRGHLRKRR